MLGIKVWWRALAVARVRSKSWFLLCSEGFFFRILLSPQNKYLQIWIRPGQKTHVVVESSALNTIFIYLIYHRIKLLSYDSVYIYLAYGVKYISWKFDVKICCKYYTVGILHDVKKTFVGIRYEWRRSLSRNWFSAIYTIVVYFSDLYFTNKMNSH